MSELKVNKVTPRSGTTVTLGDSGDTITIPSGVTLSGFGANTPAFEAYTTGLQSVTENTYTKLTFATEVFDSNSNYDNSTNYRFTPTTAGKYFCYAKATTDPNNFKNERDSNLQFYKNGASVGYPLSETMTGDNASADGATLSTHNITNIIEFNGSSDYLEVFGRLNTWNDANGNFGSKVFGAYKIIE